MRIPSIRPSACGLYIVATIGAYPQVIPLREAIALRDIYRKEEAAQRAAGNQILEEHERQMAHLLGLAINEAADFSRAAKAIVLAAE